MGKEKGYACCFFGHRKIEETNILKANLYHKIEALILEKNVTSFLFGSKSQFDDLCHTVVTELKEKYLFIERVYVRAEYQHISDEYKKYLQNFYEHTYYPEQIEKAGRASYIKRNFEMIDKSDFCVCYYDTNYILSSKGKSGTKIAYEYAKKKNRCIMNIAEKL